MTRSTRPRGRRRALGAALAVLASSAALTAVAAAPAQAAEGAPKPRVAFTEHKYVDGVRTGDTLVTVNADGTDRRVLVLTGRDVPPQSKISGVTFSPDGLRLAFITPGGSVWTANADGTNAHLIRLNLDNPEGTLDSLDWTADGRQLYASFSPTPDFGGSPSVHLIDVAGGGLHGALPRGTQVDVAWDGRITFVRGERSASEVYLWDPRVGGEPTHIASGMYPAFSPNGEQIAFSASGFSWDARAHVLDGGGEYPLTTGEYAGAGAEWSPDGSLIAYSAGGQAAVRSASVPDGTRTVLSAPGTLVDDISWIAPRGWNPHGTFRHDYGGDGRADLLALDATGVLWRYDGTGTGGFQPRQKIGWGWKGHRFTAAGDLNADGRPDALAQDPTGGLWRLDGTAGGAFGTKVKIGTGWKDFKLTGVGDLNADGFPDVLAVDATGAVWQYAGDGRGGLQARQRVGTGYTGQRFTGVGAFTRSGYQNHLGLFPNGDLHRYERGGADKIGWGWKGLTLTGAGDLSGDGVTDVLALDTAGVLWRYDGDGKGGLKPRIKAGWGWTGISLF
ncbi:MULTISPECIES: FG-GAP-like repeat-containing protein [Streptomyces]|uniref:FG-GAP-like repeat-containing protein n=1 Tax=Streptomyces TaxID=1883 RepID=UPI000AECDBD6|nr:MULTISPECIES: FG-GAP-like repeat-containing protein [Streptomyces]